MPIEGVLGLRFGNMCQEGSGYMGRDELVGTTESLVRGQLIQNPNGSLVFAKALGDLASVSYRKQAKVAIPVLEHEVVGLSNLLRGRRKRGDVCEARIHLFLDRIGDDGAERMKVFLSYAVAAKAWVKRANISGDHCDEIFF